MSFDVLNVIVILFITYIIVAVSFFVGYKLGNKNVIKCSPVISDDIQVDLDPIGPKDQQLIKKLEEEGKKTYDAEEE